MVDVNYLSAVLEEVRDQNKAVLENVGMMQNDMKLLAKQADLEEVKNDVKTIKHALRDTNNQIHGHEKRITKLESVTRP